MNNLRKIREEHGILQKEAAVALGISRATYSNYETGLRNPDPEMLRALAEFYSVSIDELLNYVPEDAGRHTLSYDERQLLKKYRSLSPMGQERTLKQIDFEVKMESKYSYEEQNPTYMLVAERPTTQYGAARAGHRGRRQDPEDTTQ